MRITHSNRIALSLAWVMALAALAVAPGCGRRAHAPTTPAAPAPPQLAQVFPPDQATAVRSNTDIWAEFESALVPASVSARTVFLKVDDLRIPSAITLDSTQRRVHIRPLIPLALLTTYTVKLSPGLETVSGASLATTYSWQFTTISVREPAIPVPPDSTTSESPFVTLSWRGNDGTPGSLKYELFLGSDSAAVAQRTLPALYQGPKRIFLPLIRWSDGRHWWSVRVTNLATSEKAEGPVWWFETAATGAQIDSVDVGWVNWNYLFVTTPGNRLAQSCNSAQIRCGPDFPDVYNWNPAGAGSPNIHLAGARLQLSLTLDYLNLDLSQLDASVWLLLSLPPICQTAIPPGPTTDEVQGRLANGHPVGPRRMRFESDALTAHLEAMIRRGTGDGFYGYTYRAGQDIAYVTQSNVELDQWPRLTLYYYSSPAPARSARVRR